MFFVYALKTEASLSLTLPLKKKDAEIKHASRSRRAAGDGVLLQNHVKKIPR